MPPTIKSPYKYAVLLCGLTGGNPVAQQPASFFQDLFVNNNNYGLDRYWNDASLGNLSLAGSQVFGWRTLSQDFNAFVAAGTASGANKADRTARVELAAQNFAQEGPGQVYFPNFDGVIVVTDQSVDLTGTTRTMNLNGQTKTYGIVICSQANSPTQIAHEMGHSLGFKHSVNSSPTSCDPNDDSTPGAYCDSWDLMSADLVDAVERPPFGRCGPLLDAVNLDLVGWLPDSRVRRFTGDSDSSQLRPLGHPDLPGPLAIQLDDMWIEFRMNNGWDEGFGSPGVLVHVNEGDHSRLLGYPNTEYLQVGDKYERGDPRFGPYVAIDVQSIDAANQSAVVGFWRKREIGAADLVGVLQWIVEGVIGIGPQGGVVIVPPRPPMRDMLVALAANELAESLSSNEARASLRQASLQIIIDTASRELQNLRE